MIEELRRAHPGRVVEVVIQPGMQVRADQRLLHAAMSNLLGNAWKFTRKKPHIEVGCSQRDGALVFHIRDNGAGFNMAYADRLFTAIRRLHTQDEFEGNGIGLVSVHRVIQRHRGRIWVEVVEGEGATFYFTLGTPATAPEGAAAGAAIAAQRAEADRRLTELQLRALHFGQSLPSGAPGGGEAGKASPGARPPGPTGGSGG